MVVTMNELSVLYDDQRILQLLAVLTFLFIRFLNSSFTLAPFSKLAQPHFC